MSDMIVTRIGNSNRKYFSDMLLGDRLPGSVELGAILDGYPVGCAVISFEGSLACIDHFYVAHDKRRQGVGRALMKKTQEALASAGIFEAICFFDEQSGLKEFLSATGFKCAPSMTRYSVWSEDLIVADRKKGLRKKAGGMKVWPVDILTTSQTDELKESLAAMGFDPSVLESKNYDPKLSFITLDEKTPRAVLLADLLPEDGILVKALASFGSGMDGVALMGAFLDAIRDRQNCLINFYMMDDRIHDFMVSSLGDDELLMEEADDWSGIWCA